MKIRTIPSVRLDISRCIGRRIREYTYEFGKYRSRVGRGRAGDVADKHLHTDGRRHQEPA